MLNTISANFAANLYLPSEFFSKTARVYAENSVQENGKLACLGKELIREGFKKKLVEFSTKGLKLQSSLEKPSDKCQRTHIIQNSFHDA